jgi:hypothetical protein
MFTGNPVVTTSRILGGENHIGLRKFHVGFTGSASPVGSRIPLGKKRPWGVPKTDSLPEIGRMFGKHTLAGAVSVAKEIVELL